MRRAVLHPEEPAAQAGRGLLASAFKEFVAQPAEGVLQGRARGPGQRALHRGGAGEHRFRAVRRVQARIAGERPIARGDARRADARHGSADEKASAPNGSPALATATLERVSRPGSPPSGRRRSTPKVADHAFVGLRRRVIGRRRIAAERRGGRIPAPTPSEATRPGEPAPGSSPTMRSTPAASPAGARRPMQIRTRQRPAAGWASLVARRGEVGEQVFLGRGFFAAGTENREPSADRLSAREKRLRDRAPPRRALAPAGGGGGALAVRDPRATEAAASGGSRALAELEATAKGRARLLAGCHGATCRDRRRGRGGRANGRWAFVAALRNRRFGVFGGDGESRAMRRNAREDASPRTEACSATSCWLGGRGTCCDRSRRRRRAEEERRGNARTPIERRALSAKTTLRSRYARHFTVDTAFVTTPFDACRAHLRSALFNLAGMQCVSSTSRVALCADARLSTTSSPCSSSNRRHSSVHASTISQQLQGRSLIGGPQRN